MKILNITIYYFILLLVVWVYQQETYKPMIDIQPVYMPSTTNNAEEITILNKFLTDNSIPEDRKNRIRNRIEELKD